MKFIKNYLVWKTTLLIFCNHILKVKIIVQTESNLIKSVGIYREKVTGHSQNKLHT